MVKYNINLKFKEDGKSLNEIITDVLKIELEKKNYATCNILNREEQLRNTNHFERKGV